MVQHAIQQKGPCELKIATEMLEIGNSKVHKAELWFNTPSKKGPCELRVATEMLEIGNSSVHTAELWFNTHVKQTCTG